MNWNAIPDDVLPQPQQQMAVYTQQQPLNLATPEATTTQSKYVSQIHEQVYYQTVSNLGEDDWVSFYMVACDHKQFLFRIFSGSRQWSTSEEI